MEELRSFLPVRQTVACGENSTVIITPDGVVKLCGIKTSLRLYDSNTQFEILELPYPVQSMVCRDSYLIFVFQNGEVYGSGRYVYEQLGRRFQGCDYFKLFKIDLPLATTVVSSCNSHILFLLQDGSVWGCGDGSYGMLGTGQGTGVYKSYKEVTPAEMILPLPAVSVSASYNNSLVLLCDGSVWGCGYNSHGQLGLGHRALQTLSAKMTLGQPATVIASEAGYSLVILLDGSVWGCGYNATGVLGIVSYVIQVTPVKMSIADMAVLINCRSSDSSVMLKDGSVWFCGGSSLPFKVTLPKEIGEVASMAGSDRHRVLICKDGSIWGYGEASYGQLGALVTSQVDVMDAVKLL